MALTSVLRSISRSPFVDELREKLKTNRSLNLSGLNRIAKGLIATILAEENSLLVITSTLEEASRWAVQLEMMGWSSVFFYPTSDALPYEPYVPDTERTWGQMQVLGDLLYQQKQRAIVCTDRALQTHLPTPEEFAGHCLALTVGAEASLTNICAELTNLGYQRTSLVENEGEWSRRGDIIDIFPVMNELPVRIDWFGDKVERIREFDPASQKTLDNITGVVLTPVSFEQILGESHQAVPSGASASLLDYLEKTTIVVFDELNHCHAHCQTWYEFSCQIAPEGANLHRHFASIVSAVSNNFTTINVTELEIDTHINLSCRSLPVIPHQFGNLAKLLREYRTQGCHTTIISAQPSRAVSLLQEHDCPAQFVPNPKDYYTIEKLHQSRTPVGIKYVGTAEIQGFFFPLFRIVIVTDREFFGQHSLGTASYVRKRRRAASKQVDPNKLSPGDFVVHRNHGIGKFLKLERLTINQETREYIVLQYEDGLLRVAADQLASLSRYRGMTDEQPTIGKLGGKAWINATNKAKKAIRKLAFDLLELYAKRSEQKGFAFPPDSPWQIEMEDSFPYQPTPDQLKATEDVKKDMESERPMDRLVCGDVGFGKTEVAVRAIFKAVLAGKQVAMLVPTTILAQQHYHTLQERFAPYPITIALLNRFKSASERKETIAKLKTGEIDIVVGTHQLLSKDVSYKDIGLLVIDEEQRFGVAQKEKIKTLKTEIDVLTLSATPIPRTLYMALSGVREMSLIMTPPPSRRSIKTHLLRYNEDAVRAAIRQELDRGGQVFYVVPRVEGIEEVSAKIRAMIPGVRIAIAHGQMPEAELETTMLTFNSGEADILVCTTIIESGLDIPRVNTIVIEEAQKFGLSQLYQLRGRVGRAGIQAHAWLLYQEKGELTPVAKERLRAIQEFTQLGSGYQLATRDMEIRGVGNVLGAEQSGQMDAIGFDLYMTMLQEAIQEIRGSKIIAVEDTQIDLPITAFIPSEYINDNEQKMTAYRTIVNANSRKELQQIAAEWQDRYGKIPSPVEQLFRVMELKQITKKLGFHRIKLENKQNVILETKIEEPAWKTLAEQLPSHLQNRFVFQSGKVVVRGLGILPAEKQIQNLIDWLAGIEVS
ncbi:MAG: transcription-repair coupling factor [Cyanobacteria bacterium M5B4]|nr:MAG: transcription-repair coupling factor [Cyanobacteria bacterium M5B4]